MDTFILDVSCMVVVPRKVRRHQSQYKSVPLTDNTGVAFGTPIGLTVGTHAYTVGFPFPKEQPFAAPWPDKYSKTTFATQTYCLLFWSLEGATFENGEMSARPEDGGETLNDYRAPKLINIDPESEGINAKLVGWYAPVAFGSGIGGDAVELDEFDDDTNSWIDNVNFVEVLPHDLDPMSTDYPTVSVANDEGDLNTDWPAKTPWTTYDEDQCQVKALGTTATTTMTGATITAGQAFKRWTVPTTSFNLRTVAPLEIDPRVLSVDRGAQAFAIAHYSLALNVSRTNAKFVPKVVAGEKKYIQQIRILTIALAAAVTALAIVSAAYFF